MEQTNELILSELAAAVNREVAVPDTLITITYVECSPDLKQAKVGFSVLPDKMAGTTKRRLEAATGQLVTILRTRVKLRKMPHLIWEFDATEKEADRIEKLISGIDDAEDGEK